MERVLTVEESFKLGRNGALVLPPVPLALFDGKLLPQLVELRLPDGSTKNVAAHFTVPRRSPPPKELEFICQFPNIQQSSVPVGTEVWAELVSSNS